MQPMMTRPFALTRGHSTRTAALAAWDEAGAGGNARHVAAPYRVRWFAFDREEFETDTAAATRLRLYMESVIEEASRKLAMEFETPARDIIGQVCALLGLPREDWERIAHDAA